MMHWQLLRMMLPAGDSEWSGHAVHSALPFSDLWEFGAQSVQGPPSLPEYPGSHSHATWALLPSCELEAAGQLVQVLTSEAPAVVEYVSAAQLMQTLAAAAPTVVEYVPAAQFVQKSKL
jgi:hypothetical protein